MRKHFLILTLLLMLGAFFVPQPEARAMDPVTIAILAPVAIKMAKVLMPYVVRGLKCMGTTGLKAGIELLGILRLPLGLVQSMFLFPFGRCFSMGIRNMGLGVIAPFKCGYYILMLPFAAFGLSP